MTIDELEQTFSDLAASFPFVSADEIPDIDLYMDQVTTFMEQKLSPASRDPESDKILTKTMINNYAKSSLLIPPVKKKYGTDHMLLLLFIFYMKSFLSISDIEQVLAPVRERYVEKPSAGKRAEKSQEEEKKSGITLKEIYSQVSEDIKASLPALTEDARKTFEDTRKAFADKDPADREVLQEFELLCRFSAEIYIKKLYIERLLDEEKRAKEEGRKKND